VRLVLIGDGPKRIDLEAEVNRLGIESSVQFLGFRDDAVAWLNDFDAFVLPSLSEGIPRCIMEAMSVSVPVVASDIPGNRNLVSHGETGLCFVPGDCNDLFEKLLFLMDHPGEVKSMANRANKKIEEEYSSWKMGREYTLLYNELMH
jgi:glycosyltransferase involved in cell wall biosynthesis